jgi:hypothetical protein
MFLARTTTLCTDLLAPLRKRFAFVAGNDGRLKIMARRSPRSGFQAPQSSTPVQRHRFVMMPSRSALMTSALSMNLCSQ